MNAGLPVNLGEHPCDPFLVTVVARRRLDRSVEFEASATKGRYVIDGGLICDDVLPPVVTSVMRTSRTFVSRRFATARVTRGAGGAALGWRARTPALFARIRRAPS